MASNNNEASGFSSSGGDDDRDIREMRNRPAASASSAALPNQEVWQNEVDDDDDDDDGGLGDEEDEEGEALLLSSDTIVSNRRDVGKRPRHQKNQQQRLLVGPWAFLRSTHFHRLAAAGTIAAGVAVAILLVASGSEGSSGVPSNHSHGNAALDALLRLKADFDVARQEMEEKLRLDYGVYYDAMFTRTVSVAVESEADPTKDEEGGGSGNTKSNSNARWLRRAEEAAPGGEATQSQKTTRVVSVGRFILQSPTFQDQLGPKRMRQRMMRKLLQVLLNDRQDSTPAASNVTFVWATGGHSSSAGHGNLYNESYTATLGRTARGVFAAVGIDFEGRNRAMGGTNSFPEIALCNQEVFGLDIDVLSWDYGMTDGDDSFGMLQYFYRTVLHPNRPAGVGFPRERNDPTWDDGRSSKRVVAMRELEKRGMASLLVDQDTYSATVDAIPDVFSVLADGADAADNMPPMVKYFKCEGGLEKGDLCGPRKYTQQEECPVRNKQVSWHEGFKWHGMMGNMFALALVEFLSDALHELLARASDPSLPPLDPSAMLAELQAVQDAEYRQFAEAELPRLAHGMLNKFPRQDEGGYELDQMYAKPAFCHIALVPSQYRYLGIFSDTHTHLGQDNYEQGVSLQHLWRNPGDLYPPDESGSVPELMQLVYDESERDRAECKLTTYIDAKDFFLVRQADDWKKVVVPTDAAIRAYPNKDPTQLEGRVAFCTTPWSTANEKDIHPETSESFNDHLFELQVNGVDVTGFDKVKHCYALRHGEGGSNAIFPPNSDGKFEIRARVLHEDYVIKFTSFIVW